ncbi:zf-HC2 domain-containing protein [bacterium]|nr:hypothetical protein [bacterium]MBU3955934.1 zf-HC2 domain-containing protein [bacterium]MBU4133766.1 zf-HC2 domain-containing protein [bacterium]
MECKKCRSLLSEYKDMELDETASAPIRRHLESCQLCRAELKAMNGISGILASIKAPSPPSDFENRVIRAMGKLSPRFSFFREGWRMPTLPHLSYPRFAAAALLIAAGIFYAGKFRAPKEYHSDIVISDAELNEFDREIMNIFYGEI